MRRSLLWLAVLAGWTALAVFFAVSSSLTFVAAYQPPQWRLTLLMSLTEWFAWAALTPLVAGLARRFPLRAGSFVASLAVHAPAGFFIAVLKVTLTRILRIPIVRTNDYFLISNLATHYVIYWGSSRRCTRWRTTVPGARESCGPRSSRRGLPRHAFRCSRCSCTRTFCSTR